MSTIKDLGKSFKESVLDPTFMTDSYKEELHRDLRRIGKDSLASDLIELRRELEQTNDEEKEKERETLKVEEKPVIKPATDQKKIDKKKSNEISTSEIQVGSNDAYVAENQAKSEIDSKSTYQSTSPSLETLLDYYADKEVIGEKDNCILQTLATISKTSFGIEGPSGSGKSHLVNPLVELFEDEVYTMELSSETAEMYNAEEINNHEIIYIPELQKAMNRGNNIVVEVVKNITEGRDANRRVRDQSKKENIVQTISHDKEIIYTLAFENNYNKDQELSRRFLQLYTDNSKEHLEDVLNEDAKRRMMTREEKRKITDEEIQGLKQHLNECLQKEYDNYINPFAAYLNEFIPKETKALSFNDYYFDLMEASAKFHNSERHEQNGNLFVNVQDANLVHTLYGQQLTLSVLDIPALGDRIIDMVQEDKASTTKDIYHQLRKTNSGITKGLVETSLGELENVGFLDKNGKNYELGSRSLNFGDEIDWQDCFQNAARAMQEKFPDQYEAWIQTQTEQGTIPLRNPISGEEKVIDYDFNR